MHFIGAYMHFCLTLAFGQWSLEISTVEQGTRVCLSSAPPSRLAEQLKCAWKLRMATNPTAIRM